MTLRKITIDNSVKQIAENQERERERERERECKLNTIKNTSLPRKQNKNIPQNNKKSMENIAAEGFTVLQ